MEDSSLYNPGFLGSGGFSWWVGQIPNDENWRENTMPGKFKDPKEVPGWGYRYKVRIIGIHDKEETTIPSDQLPWAQVMYPVTAGGGQGGSAQTPAIKQGNFVFGFFLDSQEQQVPVIMGILGANAQTPKALNKSNGKVDNFISKSGYSGSTPDVTGEKTGDTQLSLKKPEGKNVPTKETPTAVHQKAAADNKEEEVLDKKHALSCPDPEENTAMKGIQTVIENLQKKIEKFQKSIKDFSDAVSLNIKNALKDINKAIDDAAKEISKFMKEIYGKIQEWITDQYNKALKVLEKISLPTFRIDLLELKIQGFEKIACLFNKLSGLLQGLLGAALSKLLGNQKNKAEEQAAQQTAQQTAQQAAQQAAQPNLTSPGSEVVPPLPLEDYYRPVPICSAEELVGDVLGQQLDEMMGVYNDAIGPVISGIQNSLLAAGVPADQIDNASTPTTNDTISKISGIINEQTITAALQSGDLVSALTSTLAGALGIDPNITGTLASIFQGGDIAQGLLSLASLAGKDVGNYATALSSAISAINNNDLVGGLSSLAGAFGADPKILSQVGSAFSAIKAGDIGALTSSIGQLAGLDPQILGILQKGDILGQLAGLGGLNFDVAAALSFISSLTSLFNCDPKPKCSPNDTHTLQAGGSGKPGKENPNALQLAQKAAESALAKATGGGSLLGAATAAEAKLLENKPTFETPLGSIGIG